MRLKERFMLPAIQHTTLEEYVACDRLMHLCHMLRSPARSAPACLVSSLQTAVHTQLAPCAPKTQYAACQASLLHTNIARCVGPATCCQCAAAGANVSVCNDLRWCMLLPPCWEQPYTSRPEKEMKTLQPTLFLRCHLEGIDQRGLAAVGQPHNHHDAQV